MDRKTDGQLTTVIPRFALRAWRGKNNTVTVSFGKYTFMCFIIA